MSARLPHIDEEPRPSEVDRLRDLLRQREHLHRPGALRPLQHGRGRAERVGVDHPLAEQRSSQASCRTPSRAASTSASTFVPDFTRLRTTMTGRFSRCASSQHALGRPDVSTWPPATGTMIWIAPALGVGRRVAVDFFGGVSIR